jgi:uncharacterized protein (DUF58 family)
LSQALHGVEQAELSRLSRVADRLLIGSPTLPYGTSPRSLRAGRGLEFLELQPYSDGDDPRRIDWRATARHRRPLVRRYQDEAFSTVLICLDRSASMSSDGGGKWRLALQLSVAFAYLLLQAGHRVGLVGFSSGVDLVSPPARGHASFAQLLARLSGVEARAEGGASRLEVCARFAARGTSVVILSDFLAPDFLRPGLDQILRRGGRLHGIRILSASELGPARFERAVLRDLESGERRSLLLTPVARRRAARRLEQLGSELRDYFHTRGLPLTSCESRQSWREVILAHLRAVGPFHA